MDSGCSSARIDSHVRVGSCNAYWHSWLTPTALAEAIRSAATSLILVTTRPCAQNPRSGAWPTSTLMLYAWLERLVIRTRKR